MKERQFTQADVKLPLDQAIAVLQLSSVDLVLDRTSQVGNHERLLVK